MGTKKIEPTIPRRPRRAKGISRFAASENVTDEYTEKERRQGVMVNIRMSADQHLDLRAEAFRMGTSVSEVISERVFGKENKRLMAAGMKAVVR